MDKNKKPSVFGRLNQKGQEVLSKIPRVLNVPFRRPVSEHQRFRQWLDAESKAANAKGRDTYEEFMDFGVEEPDLPNTQWELVFDPRTGREMYPAEKMHLDAMRAKWDQEQAQKRPDKRQRIQNESAAEQPLPSKEVPKIEQTKKAPKQKTEPTE